MPRLHLTFFLLFFCHWYMPSWAYTVSGTIQLDEDWERKIYLSLIPSFDDLNTASSELIVHMANIDSDGNFELAGKNLPISDRLYRLHVCKKGDPSATLFIGGKEENHFHFIMNNSSGLTFRSNGLFRDVKIMGHPANVSLFQMEDELSALRTPPHVNSKMNRENRRAKMNEFLFQFVDTCSHSIPAMFAIVQFGLEKMEEEHSDYIHEKIQSWAGADMESPYLLDLQKRVDIARHKAGRSGKSWFMEGLLILGILVFFYFFRKKISERKNEANLSVQERRVLSLLSVGKSNKEISEELHIEVSTVKSHVSKIYSKLGVRSRKEVVGKF